MATLRPYQQDAMGRVRELLKRKRKSILLVLPTGAGKTVIFTHMARGASNRQKRVLILAHRDKLIRQASGKLDSHDTPHGIIMAGFPLKRTMNIQVASVQTMARRIQKFRFRFDLIIIDEAHLSAAKSYLNVVAAIRKCQSNAVIIGVTGSPYRLDGKGLGVNAGGLYEDMVVGVTGRELIDDGYLVQPVTFGARLDIDYSSVKVKGGDLDLKEQENLVDKPAIVGDAVDHYMEVCPNVPALAWCVTVKHANDVAATFNAAGIPAVALSAEADTDERERVLGAVAAGTIKVVTFCNLLIEGVDVPELAALIILRRTLSLSAYLQVVGRILRPVYAEGMPLDTREQRLAAIEAGPKGGRGIILDHAGCWFLHGFADDEREWSLDGEIKRSRKKKDDDEKVPLLQCPKCYHVHKPEPACPACGHVYQTAAKKPLEQVDGKLTEITPEMREEIQREKMKTQGAARSLEQLMELGHSAKAATRILEARATKQALIADTVAAISDWQSRTQGNIMHQFGLTLAQIRNQKPKKLKALLEHANDALAQLDHPERGDESKPRTQQMGLL